MFSNHQLRSRIAVVGVVLGASVGTGAITSAAAATRAPTSPSLTQVVTGLAGLHLSPANLAIASRDSGTLAGRAVTPASGGLSGILQALSQVNGIKGTQFGNDLSSLATDSANEDVTVDQNEIAGAEKLEAESAGYPAPFNTLFYNLGAALLKNAQGSSPAASGQ